MGTGGGRSEGEIKMESQQNKGRVTSLREAFEGTDEARAGMRSENARARAHTCL